MRWLILVLAILIGPVWCYQFSRPESFQSKTGTLNSRDPLKRLMDHDIQFFREGLAQEKVNFKEIRSRAVIISLAAHFSMKGNGSLDLKLASLRNNAIRLAETPRVEEAKQIVERLLAETKSNPAKVPASLQRYLEDLTDLHNLMKPKSIGGLGIELEISEMAKGSDEPLTNQMRERVSIQAYRVAVIAQATEAWFAKKFPDKKIAKILGPWAGEMRRAADQLRMATGSESDLEIRQHAGNLRVTCVTCHRYFVNGIIPAPPKDKKKS
jgi:hypothetical protein